MTGTGVQRSDDGKANARGTWWDDRARRWTAVIAIGLLALLLVPDVVALPTTVGWIRKSGNDYMALLVSQKHNQIVNFVIGEALHDKRIGPIKTVFAPADLTTLSARPGDQMLGGVKPALQRYFLARLVRGEFVETPYDPQVSTATVAAWSASGRLVAYARDVYLLRPPPGSDGRWVLLADPTRTKILVVPAADAPTGVSLP
jgi:hypothetical protein